MASEIMNLADLDRSTAIILDPLHDPVGMSINDVLKWIEPNAPPGEALKFLLVCRSFGLNPFASEAYLIKMGDRWGTVVGKYGYLKRAQRHPEWDGFEAGIVVQEMEKDPRTGNIMPGRTRGLPIEVEGTILPPGCLLVGGWARVWRKGVSRPVKTRVSLAEYDKGTATWKSIKCTMICKVALVHAIREAFAFGDAYDESEFEPVARRRPTEDGRPGPMVATVSPGTNGHGQHALVGPPGSIGGDPQIEVLYAGNPDPICPPDMMEAIERLRVKLGKDTRWLDGILMKRGVANVAALSPVQAGMFISWLEGIASRGDFLDAMPDGVGEHYKSIAHSGGMPLDAELVGAGVDVAHAPVAHGGHAGATYAEIPTGDPDDGDSDA